MAIQGETQQNLRFRRWAPGGRDAGLFACSIYGLDFRRRAEGMGLEEILIAPRSPWQSPYVKRLIGSIRRECLNHVIQWRLKSGLFASVD